MKHPMERYHGWKRIKHAIYRLWHPWSYDPLSLEEDFYFPVTRSTVKHIWHIST